jgi:L-lactate dehydrogenase complex protein LldG
MSAARGQILARVRATSHTAPPSPAPTYSRASSLTAGERVARFCERVADYRAEVHRISAADAARTIGRCLERYNARAVAVPRGFPAAWRPGDSELVDDDGLTVRALDALDGVLTGCTVAIAETGTIVLAGGPSEGRRAVTLVPDLHVCLVEASQIVGSVPDAIAALEELVRTEGRPLTFISGPSATSDIELSRVEGVHGPRKLVVVVIE